MVGPDDIAAAILTNKELMVLIYKDLAQPGVQQVGKALGTVLQLCNTALMPIRWGNEVAELVFSTNMEKFRKRLEGVPIAEIQEVPPELGVPIIERLTHVRDDMLADMFVNLLAMASEQKHANAAHPAFVSIINNLAPDEALLLKVMKTVGIKYFANGGLTHKPNDGHHVLQPIYFLLDPFYTDPANLTFPDYIDSYIRNLERLGIIKTDQRVSQKEVSAMENREGDELNNPISRIKKRYTPRFQASHIYNPRYMHVYWSFGKLDYTEFGRFFRHSCVERVWQPSDANE